jgi:hypothetical protein
LVPQNCPGSGVAAGGEAETFLKTLNLVLITWAVPGHAAVVGRGILYYLRTTNKNLNVPP